MPNVYDKIQHNNHAAVPLNLGKEFGFEDTPGLQSLRDLTSEEEATLCQVNQDVPYNFTQVHTTAHLLIPKKKNKTYI